MFKRFGLTFLLSLLFDILIVMFLGGYNTYTDDYDLDRGFDALGDVFGGVGSFLLALAAFGAVIGLGYILYTKLWKQGKHGIVLIIAVILTIIVMSGALSWISIGGSTFTALPLALFIALQSWAVTFFYRKALKKAVAQIPAQQPSA